MDRYSHLFDGAYADVNDELEQAWEAAETASGPASVEGASGAAAFRVAAGREQATAASEPL